MKLTDYIWQFILTGIISYLIGNINSAVIISKKIKHQDIRQQGSKNPGTTNMMRVFGIKMGAVTLICDMIKGVIPVLLTRLVFGGLLATTAEIFRFAMYLSAFCVTLGHVFPVFMNFKGGKGFATSVGIMLVIQPLPTAIIVLLGLGILFLCDRMSVFALFYVTAELVFHIFAYINTSLMAGHYMNVVTLPMLIIVVLFWILVVFAHRANIVRLLKGEENPSGLRKGLFSRKKKEQSDEKTETK